MKKILLTGGNGYIGKNFLSAYGHKYQINAPSRAQLNLVNSKMVDEFINRTDEIDAILHAANVGGTRNTTYTEQNCLFENLMTFRNVFQHASVAKRFIQFGSGAEYAKPLSEDNVSENNIGKTIPLDAYGLSKFLTGQFLENQQAGRFVNMRIFGVFGPDEDYHIRFISNAIVRSLLGLPIVINKNAIFDYVYIDDFLKILTYFIENPAPQISYNITAGQPVSLLDLAEIVRSLTNNNHGIVVKNEGISEIYTGNNARLISFLPPTFTFTPIEDAIKKLVHWYEGQLSTINLNTEQ